MAQVGAGVESPVTLLREYADAVRDLLDGRRVDPGRAVVKAYTQVDPSQPPGVLPEQVAERVALLSEAGADTVILQGTGKHPDPRPLVEALQQIVQLT